MYCTVYCIVIRFPATIDRPIPRVRISARGASTQYGLRVADLRSPCEYCTNKVKNTRPRLAVSEKKREKKNCQNFFFPNKPPGIARLPKSNFFKLGMF